MDAAERWERERRNTRLLAGGTAVLVLAAIGTFFWLDAPKASSKAMPEVANPAKESPPPAAPVAAPVPDPPEPAPARAPADPDAMLRKIVGSWSSSPELAAWLTEQGILQRVAAATNLIARGSSPKPVLGFVKIPGDFGVDEELTKNGNDVVEHDFISARSYARYDRLTQIVTAIDPATAARGYAQLEPLFESVYAQIASPGERFKGVLKSAMTRMVNVPVPAGRVEVVPAGALYKYLDPALEGRKPAEKHLLRFGPQNQRAIQAWLQSFAAAANLTPLE